MVVLAQDRCGTVPYTKELKKRNLVLETEEQFENWIENKIANRKAPLDTKAEPYKIPVVVHVIHKKDEPEGSGSNISDAQILSQIEVLNEDFRRLNPDKTDTPAEFLSVAGSLDIEFVMAKRTPEGLPTDGIVRVEGTQSTWTLSDNFMLKSLSYWPAEDYLNIWVTDLAGLLIGFGQFPVSNQPGLDESPDNRLTDGVVIDYRNFGSIDDGSFNLDANYNKGRTTTHEVGHFFGLKHIWADDENDSNLCLRDDYVDDTPKQDLATTSCPTHPQASCSTNDMFQNYMDYTFDECMNLFTNGQVDRMIAVIENSPRRTSLLNSPGLEPPDPVAYDLGIRSIIAPQSAYCAGTFTPAIEVRNYGVNEIDTATITMTINSVEFQTKHFKFNPPLDTEDIVVLTFDDQTLSPGDYTFEFDITQISDTIIDGNPTNDSLILFVRVPDSIAAPFSENFNTLPPSWTIINYDNDYTWELKNAPATTSANAAMYLNFYHYEDSPAEIDILKTPVFDLSGSDVETAYFLFDVAYAQYIEGGDDGLKVFVLTDCQPNLIQGIERYNKSGLALATASATSKAFVPSGPNDWRREVVDISSFVGEDRVQLAFVGINDWGNNLYIDNINLVTSADEDMAITQIVRPSPVSCNNEIAPIIKAKNFGNPINSFKIEFSLNGGPFEVAGVYEDLALPLGGEIELRLPAIFFQDGLDSITFRLTEPNGLVDINQSDNISSIQLIINRSSDRIPLRENFDDEFAAYRWSSVNPNGGMKWETISTNYGQSFHVNAYNNAIAGDRSWLVSPVLDFSRANAASMFFDLSYDIPTDSATDQLEILASTNCGDTYFRLLHDSVIVRKNNDPSDAPWSPSAEGHWVRNFVPMNSLAGDSSIRVAFVLTNATGNNVYIDNVEFFLSDDPNPSNVAAPFRIYNTNPSDPGDFYLTFALETRQPVRYEVIDVMGNTLADAELPDILNQTFLIDAGIVQKGIYIVRLRIGENYFATKVLLGH